MTGASVEAVPMRRSAGGATDPRSGEDAAARRMRKGGVTETNGVTGRPGGRFVRRGRNYGRTIFWTVVSTFGAEPRRFAVALAIGGLSLAAQALAVLVVYGFGQAIQRDGGLVVPLLGIDWNARTNLPFLLAVVAGFGASLSTSVLLNFLSQGLLLGIVRRSLARAIERLARAINALPDPRAPTASRLAADIGFNRLDGGLAAAARSAFLIVQTVPALVGAAVSAGLLLWMEPILTLILFAVAAAWTAFLYPVALRMARFGRDLRRAGGVVRRDFPLVPPAPTIWAAADEVAADYTGWLRARVRIIVIVGVGVALIVSIAIYVMGAEMMSGNQEWPALIAYIGALQVALNGAFRMVRGVAVVSRHYPEMVRNRLLVDDLAGLARPLPSLAKGEVVTLGRHPGGQPITAVIGEWLAVVAEEPIQRLQLAALGARDAAGNAVRSERLARDARRTPSGDAPILFIEDRMLGDGGKVGMGTFADRLVVVVHSRTTTVGSFGEARLLVVDDDSITAAVAIGSEAATLALDRAAKRAEKAQKRRADYGLEDMDVE